MTEAKRHKVVIGIGSNTIDSSTNVAMAIEWCSDYFEAAVSSSIYSTRPYGDKASSIGSDYSNAVVVALTEFDSSVVINSLKSYETQHGRDSFSRISGVVTIDLDLVIYDDNVLRPQEIDREYFAKGYGELTSESHSK